MKRFRCRLVFKAHRLCVYHSTLVLRVINKRRREVAEGEGSPHLSKDYGQPCLGQLLDNCPGSKSQQFFTSLARTSRQGASPCSSGWYVWTKERQFSWCNSVNSQRERGLPTVTPNQPECEDRVLDGPVSGGKGFKGGLYKKCNPRTCMNYPRLGASVLTQSSTQAEEMVRVWGSGFWGFGFWVLGFEFRVSS